MSSCCGTQEKEDHCHPSSNKTDYLFWGALSIVALGYLAHLIHLPFGDSFLGGKKEQERMLLDLVPVCKCIKEKQPHSLTKSAFNLAK